MALLSLSSLAVRYLRRTVLEGLDLSLEPGTITALLGPNGAGKSTVLKAIFGLAPVIAGRVEFAGEDITGRWPVDLLARGIAYLPQGGQVFGALTVTENLRVAAAQLTESRPLTARLAEAWERFPELEPRRQTAAGALSGGQRQQLAIAMALLGRPRLLLVDEPSIGLAPRLARQALELVAALSATQGTAVLLVEQNVALALEVADHAVLLLAGACVDRAASAALRADPVLRRQFTLGLASRAEALVGAGPPAATGL